MKEIASRSRIRIERLHGTGWRSIGPAAHFTGPKGLVRSGQRRPADVALALAATLLFHKGGGRVQRLRDSRHLGYSVRFRP
jgi:xanthine/CO dehydrogenase XdhC/CoxF family maturation factor